jgi:hypothetical protein
MMEQFDLETGEVPDKVQDVGAAATAHMIAARQADQRLRLGLDNRSLHHALYLAQLDLAAWITTDKPGAHKIKYATLKTILETVRPVLLRHHIRVRQGAERSFMLDEGGGSKGRLVPVYTDLIHVITGELERTTIEIPVTRLDPPAMGSAITYGKRYSILAALGLATDEADDDGARALPTDIKQAVTETSELAALKADISKVKDADKLISWSDDAKISRRIEKLTDDEKVLLRAHYQNHARKLLEINDGT